MKRVLVVDDNLDILNLVQLILTNNGFEVMTSPKGGDVFINTETFAPQVILLDVYLSGFDGRDICKSLKQNDKTRNIPVIMFSAHCKSDDIIDCKADDFIAKPFDVNELVNKITLSADNNNLN